MKKKTKILFIVWGVLVLSLIVVLTIIGLKFKFNEEKYENLEDRIEKAAELYVYNSGMRLNKAIKITSDELIKNGYLKDFNYDKDVCTGYVLVYQEPDLDYEFEPFIKCGSYKTLGY